MKRNTNSANLKGISKQSSQQSLNKWSIFLIILSVVVVVVAAGAYYVGTQKNSGKPYSLNTSSPTSTQSTNKIGLTSSPSPDQKSEWKTYTGTAYTFMYPPDWKQTGPTNYLETVQLLNAANTVSITISKGQYPYGFDAAHDTTTNPITIDIDGKTIPANEIISSKGAYVDFAIGEYHILYGTDYPAVGTHASLTDYNASKQTIAEILSSFKLTQ